MSGVSKNNLVTYSKDGKNKRRKNTARLFENKAIISVGQSSEQLHQQYAEYLHQYEQ